MKETNEIPREIKWHAVKNCDRQFDGKFFYAVKTTGIFCRPSCQAKTPLKKNTLFFDRPEDAVNAGFRPCKMCRPDIHESRYEPNKELIAKTEKMLIQHYSEGFKLKVVAQELGMSESNLTRVFKQYYDMTPSEYVMKIRVKKATELLRGKDKSIVEIAHEVGFKSLSTFYKNFKENIGCTPREYRKRT